MARLLIEHDEEPKILGKLLPSFSSVTSISEFRYAVSLDTAFFVGFKDFVLLFERPGGLKTKTEGTGSVVSAL